MRPALRNLCLLHLLGTAVLLWTGYYWLGVGEASAMTLTWSAAVALMGLLAALWLHGTALAYFRGDDSPLKTALRNLLPLAVLAIGVAGIYMLLSHWQAPNPQRALKTASWLTFKSRTPVRPSSVLFVMDGVFALLRWWVIPAVVLPLAAGVAGAGWRGFLMRFCQQLKRWVYWVEVPALLLCALWIPWQLLHWVPRVRAFWLQMTSFTLRASVAYLLLVGALLALDYIAARGGVPLRNATSPPAAVPDPAK